MESKIYELNECLFSEKNRHLEMKDHCARIATYNAHRNPIYVVNSGVAIRSHKMTYDSEGNRVHTTLLLKEGALVVPRKGTVISNCAFVENHRFFDWTPNSTQVPAETTTRNSFETQLSYAKGQDVRDFGFDGTLQGINSIPNNGKYFSFI